MANMSFANNAATTLSSGITNSATSLTVASGTGALFPAISGSQYFYCTLQVASGTTLEIVKVTARSTDTFTIVRAQDGTTASAFSTGDKVELRLVRANLTDFALLDENNTFTFAPTFNTALGISSGGTGQTTASAAFNALSPITSTGDLILGNGTNSATRLGIGTSGYVLTSNGTTASWVAAPGGSSIGSITSASSITPSGSNTQYEVTALAVSATINAPSGTPTDGQKLLIRIKDNGTAQTLTWTTTTGAYRVQGVSLPTTTVINTPVYIGSIYNSQDNFWDVVAVS